jgi:hypothetical protein
MTDPADPRLPLPARSPDAPTGAEPALPGRAAALAGNDVRHEPLTVDETLIGEALHRCFAGGSGFPRRRRLRAAVLLVVRAAMEPGRGYSEPDMNALFRRHLPWLDTSTARVYMIEFGMLDRFPDGSAYWASDRFRAYLTVDPSTEARLPAWAARLQDAVRTGVWL